MPVFAHLEIEPDLQIGDRTRLNAYKSFVTKGENALTSLEITAGSDGSAIDVFDTNGADFWYLDWQFDAWTMDIDATNNKIDFSEGNTIYEATLTTGTYTRDALATEIETQLNAEGTHAYTVAFDVDDKITISADGSFSLQPTGDNKLTSILPIIGFSKNTEAATSFTGKRTEYFVKKIQLDVENDATPTPVTDSETKYIKLYSVDGDKLFSDDGDLIRHESDVMKWVYPGRNTFKDIHRRAQQRIIKWLDEKGYVDIYDNKFTKAAFVDLDEVRDWSTYMVLKLIFQGISNAKDDVFKDKAKAYELLETEARQRAILRIDIDNDGNVESNEGVQISTGTLWNR